MILQTRFKVSKWSSKFSDLAVFLLFLGFCHKQNRSEKQQLRPTQDCENFPLSSSSDWITVKYLYQLKIINQIISCLSQCVSLITLLVRNPANNKFLGLSTCSGLC